MLLCYLFIRPLKCKMQIALMWKRWFVCLGTKRTGRLCWFCSPQKKKGCCSSFSRRKCLWRRSGKNCWACGRHRGENRGTELPCRVMYTSFPAPSRLLMSGWWLFLFACVFLNTFFGRLLMEKIWWKGEPVSFSRHWWLKGLPVLDEFVGSCVHFRGLCCPLKILRLLEIWWGSEFHLHWGPRNTLALIWRVFTWGVGPAGWVRVRSNKTELRLLRLSESFLPFVLLILYVIL